MMILVLFLSGHPGDGRMYWSKVHEFPTQTPAALLSQLQWLLTMVCTCTMFQCTYLFLKKGRIANFIHDGYY